MKTTAQHWFIRFKIYHLPFWMVYHYIWAVINNGQPLEMIGILAGSPKFLFYVVCQATAVYFNLYYLIPRFLEKGKYTLYILLLTTTVVSAAIIIATSYFISAYVQGSTALKIYGHDNLSWFFWIISFPSTLTATLLAMSIKLTRSWIQSKKREQLLEKEKLETELKFLRSQLNPHFLFNSINSIFVLIHKNPDMASEALAKFSGLLRYQLYESNEVEIPLQQELQYLHNYIELEKLRQDKHLEIKVNVNRSMSNDFTIAPLLLIPIIENAFKHVSAVKGRINWINIDVNFDGNKLVAAVDNSVSEDQRSREVIKHGGIGLKNVERRLNLIYENEHTLEIKKEQERFIVLLSIHLHKINVNQPGLVKVD